MRTTYLCSALLTLSFACAGEITTDEPFVITERSGEYLEGHAAAGDHRLEFVSTVDDGAAVVMFLVNGKGFEYGLDMTSGATWFDGQGATLDVEEVEFLAGLVPVIVDHLGSGNPDDLDAAAAMFVANFAHLKQAPADFPIVGQTTGNPHGDIVPASLSNNGITCVKKGVSTWVQWDDYGGIHTAWVVPGTGKHCFGKCGDCGFGPDQWTLDCTEHDQCGKASTGSLDWNPWDPQCGDEFQNATDDFTLFWIKRCRG